LFTLRVGDDDEPASVFEFGTGSRFPETFVPTTLTRSYGFLFVGDLDAERPRRCFRKPVGKENGGRITCPSVARTRNRRVYTTRASPPGGGVRRFRTELYPATMYHRITDRAFYFERDAGGEIPENG